MGTLVLDSSQTILPSTTENGMATQMLNQSENVPPPKRRSFANKLNTVRSYKEISKDDLTNGDLIKQMIRPRGKPVLPSIQDNANPDEPVQESQPEITPKILPFSPPPSPRPELGRSTEQPSPTTIVKAIDSTEPEEPKELPTRSSLKSKRVSFNAEDEIRNIPTTKYLEQIELENTRLKERESMRQKEMQVLIQERDSLEQYKSKLERAQNAVLDRVAHRLVEYDNKIEGLQKVIDDQTLEIQQLRQSSPGINLPSKATVASVQTRNETENLQLKEQIKGLQLKLDNAMSVLRKMEEERQVSPKNNVDTQALLSEAQRVLEAERRARVIVQQTLDSRYREFEAFKKSISGREKTLFYIQLFLWFIIVALLVALWNSGTISFRTS